MIVKQTTDLDEIKRILHHEDIYDTISDIKEKVDPPITDDYQYIGGYVDGKIFALMVYHKYKDGKECHVQVLKTHRSQYAMEFGKKALGFNKGEKTYAEIPDYYKNVLEFSFLFGFKVIDIIKNGFRKNGKDYNINILRLEDGFY